MKNNPIEMIIEFQAYIKESLTYRELVDELKDAKFIEVDFNMDLKCWGVKYTKNGKSHFNGKFNSSNEVHEFLIDNDIDYGGKEGFDYMIKYRNRLRKNHYPGYQKELELRGIKNRL